jgi:glycosyltransferase involved in cell wall biosynthesis
VAIPTYQGALHIHTAIESVIAQTMMAPAMTCRLLLIDDHSEDGTLLSADLAVRGSGLRSRLMRNPARLGLAGNWNRCMRESETEWVAFLHQDDCWESGHLWAHAQAAAAFPEAGIIAGPAGTIDAAGAVVPEVAGMTGQILKPPERPPDSTWSALESGAHVRAWSFQPGDFVEHLISGNPLRCSAVSIRAAAFESLGGFDARWNYVVDWDLWLRMARAFPVVWVESSRGGKTSLAWCRWHGANESHRQRRGRTDLEEIEQLFHVTEQIDRPKLGDRWQRLDQRRRAWLARAYLNRAQELGWRAGEVEQGLVCLDRAKQWDPRGTRLLGSDWRGRFQLVLLERLPGLVRGLRGGRRRTAIMENE